MASTYILPLSGSAVQHGHGHERGHARHSRIQSQPMAIDRLSAPQHGNTGSPLRNETSNTTSLHPSAQSHAHPEPLSEDALHHNLVHHKSNSALPRQYYPGESLSPALPSGFDMSRKNSGATAYPQSNGGIYSPLPVLSSVIGGHDHHDHHHHHHHHPDGHDEKVARSLTGSGAVHGAGNHSRITGYLLERVRPWPLVYSILVEKDSRRIFYFMSLNFAFMLVQTFYGIATGSLGLLSDSIHMLFDCLALAVGLCAAVMSKWPPSMRFPYGLGKMDTLAGFANGIFLMLISIEIVTEAIERLYEGSEMKRIGELLTVSTLGLAVNLVGIMAFDHAHHGHGHSHGGHSHGHGHSHGGHSHGHDHKHDHHDHSADDHGHDHGHSHAAAPAAAPSHAHGHSHGNENMHGIFLHILADTLGSAAVVVSTLLIHFFHWPGFDPLASCFIAILIFASAIPLVKSSAKTLLLTVPAETEYNLRDTLAGVSGLRGVAGYCVPRFWIEGADEGGVMGVMHVIASRGSDLEEVRDRVVGFLGSKRADVVVQVEREGDGRCWCGGGLAGKST